MTTRTSKPLLHGSAASVDTVEHALASLVRYANLRKVQDRLRFSAGDSFDRFTYDLLKSLDPADGVRISDLALALGVDVSTTSRQAATAVEAELVERRADPQDARACLLHLTDDGRAVLERLRDVRREMVDALMVEWNEDEITLFASLLARFAESLTSHEFTP